MSSYVSTLADLSKHTNDPNKLIVLDFTATWCGPCKQISPIFENLANQPENSNVNFFKIDIDQAPDVAQEFGISSVPTFIFLKGDDVVEKFSGASPPKLREGIAQLLKAGSSD